MVRFCISKKDGTFLTVYSFFVEKSTTKEEHTRHPPRPPTTKMEMIATLPARPHAHSGKKMYSFFEI
jgi:hypothetical protein